MEKQQSFNGITSGKHSPTQAQGLMERQQSIKQSTTRGRVEKQLSFRVPTTEKPPSSHRMMEKQKSFQGFMEKQKSFRVVMERQLSFIGVGERRKNRESPGKRGDSPLHLAARTVNLTRVREILQNCDDPMAKEFLAKQNLEGETPLYVAAENGQAAVVTEMLKHMDLETASIAASNGYDPFHVAAKQGHVGKSSLISHFVLRIHHSFRSLTSVIELIHCSYNIK